MKAVKKNMLFSSYSHDELEIIIELFEPISVTNGQTVIYQGTRGDAYFIVESGKLEVRIQRPNGTYRHGHILTSGASFGELSLMYETPRTATVRAVQPCTLWVIRREDYKKKLLAYQVESNMQYALFVRSAKINDKTIGSIFYEEQTQSLTNLFERMNFNPKDLILPRGSTCSSMDSFYIVARGMVSVYDIDPTTGEEKLVNAIMKG